MDNRVFLVIEYGHEDFTMEELGYPALLGYDRQAASTLRVGESTTDCASHRIIRLEDKSE